MEAIGKALDRTKPLAVILSVETELAEWSCEEKAQLEPRKRSLPLSVIGCDLYSMSFHPIDKCRIVG